MGNIPEEGDIMVFDNIVSTILYFRVGPLGVYDNTPF